MKEQKNIERLFQEKFKDFEVAPPEMAWNNIEARLNEKKKKRRLIPFWFKASGIAASLLLGFYMYTYFNTDSISINPKNSTVEKNSNSIDKNNQENIIKSIIKPDELSNEDESVMLSGNKNSTNPNNSINKEETQGKNSFNKKQKSILVETSKNLVSVLKNNIKNKQKSNQITEDNSVGLEDNKPNVIVFENNNNKNKDSNLSENKIDFDKINGVLKDKKSSAISEKSANNKTQDSSLVAKISEEVNALEQLLKEKEVGKNVEEKEKEMQNRWAVSSNASPVYFNSSSKTSTLDTKFDSNDKGYNSNLSYGLGISFAINNKISIRTGVNTLNFNSNTKDILFYQRNNPSTIDNLSRNTRGSLINIENKLPDDLKEIDFYGGELIKYSGELSQELGYLEIPLELSYMILDKKFSINLIGGMSTLFLNNNNVSIVSNDMSMEIGSATNLNSIHYSTNFGMGFSYTFLKSFQANINPMFKYQLNTYTDNSNNIKPYFIGLYSGLSYKF
ncbi:hypothetical protein FLGE108171_03340 [Flavobacterium gelidilacus]|uniref:hypothetical protein n=1 Tax=Flavobacterium gelidilacus TaxID=206041 RepID=UPI0003F8C0F8|nr:hypothetical protein [Flavobacterium gelidilacus]